MLDYKNFADSPIAPARHCFGITPDDAASLPWPTKGIYVGQAGDIALRSVNADADVVFRNVPAGVVLDVCASAVRAAGTTAGDLVGMA
ncbi:hypothetical protein RXV95_03170 [Novosphingobium sp. ZN18A2]|uniref:spike base protein, RCAP_Rcc01079 family n=1 Tax=Novosphingobium sp. ZN18A2 TaxID=3079861 RepID=UPI0030D17074